MTYLKRLKLKGFIWYKHET